jgi:hypothetical protein
MTERGVDMHKVRVSKAEAVLWGVERIGKWKKAKSNMVKNSKEEVKDGMQKVANLVKTNEGDTSHWKIDILEGRRRKSQQRIPEG